MSTNFYVEWTPPGQGTDSDAAVCVTTGIPIMQVRMHIGKNGTNFNGTVFNSWAAWKHFLWANRDDVTITSEYSDVRQPEEFFKYVEDSRPDERRRQFDWMNAHYAGDAKGAGYWLDADGFTFSTGDFS